MALIRRAFIRTPEQGFTAVVVYDDVTFEIQDIRATNGSRTATMRLQNGVEDETEDVTEGAERGIPFRQATLGTIRQFARGRLGWPFDLVLQAWR